jgi:hypothetical protein
MDSPKEVLDWAIQMMKYKVDRVKALLEQVLQSICSLSFGEGMKRKSDVVGEMDHLVHDSQQCLCLLDKFRRDHDLTEVLDWAIKMMQHKMNSQGVG